MSLGCVQDKYLLWTIEIESRTAAGSVAKIPTHLMKRETILNDTIVDTIDLHNDKSLEEMRGSALLFQSWFSYLGLMMMKSFHSTSSYY